MLKATGRSYTRIGNNMSHLHLRSVQKQGITTHQMRSAPRDSIYVWLDSNFLYPRRLAKLLGRDDLKIVSPDFLSQYEYVGLSYPAVLDHATRLTRRQVEAFEEINRRYQLRKERRDEELRL